MSHEKSAKVGQYANTYLYLSFAPLYLS